MKPPNCDDLSYEDLAAQVLRYSTDCGPYDFVGVVHLLLAAVDNLRSYALDTELADLAGCCLPAQVSYIHRLSQVLRDHPVCDEDVRAG